MILKTYQQNTLDTLQRFFEVCRIAGAENAYNRITGDPEIAVRLGKLRGDYIKWDSIPNTPRICLKVPTGGGKTIIAAHAVKIVSDTWCEKENPVVLWFCPSDTVRRQTSEALKNPRHPYRIVLDEQFGGRVRIFDIDEKFNIRPADIENNACVIVSTIQAFRQDDTSKYNVYRHNEELEPHFTHISATEGMETDDKGNLKFSFANLMHHHCPIVIVDEAHNVISGLSQEMQGRLNPSAIVELTATPQLNNNTLYNAYAAEVKEQEMIKLPIELREHLGWERAVDEAILKRAELEKDAAKETEYLRPILLFQAQNKNGEINAETLKKYLLETANIPENEIAIATGAQKELDGVDIFSRDCPVKFIITVEALKEGWDCSFAYVLCSLANVQSNTAIEQLLGRVMRMPYAKTRKTAALNKAYAYVLSQKFGEAAEMLVDKLKTRGGFDENEAKSAVEQKTSELGGLFGREEINKIDFPAPLAAEQIPPTIRTENNGRTIIFTPETTDHDVATLAAAVLPDQAAEMQNKFANYKRMNLTPAPAAQGEKFIAPKLMVAFGEQDEFVFADPEIIFEAFDWNIAKFTEPKLEEKEFNITLQANGFVIDIDDERLIFSPFSEQLSLPQAEVKTWTAANLIDWLDKTLRQDDIPQPEMVSFLGQIVEFLTGARKMDLSALMLARYALSSKIKDKIKSAREKAREEAFQTSLFARESRVMLDFDHGFVFRDGMYDGELFYQGNYRFQKHFLGAYRVPMLDGGEETDCAKAIDFLPQVQYWLRNVARHKNSFWLPTSTDRFYPDFVALLNDGRILVVEYKGAHLIDSRDTKEKRLIGELWERHTAGKGVFLLAEKSRNGLDVAAQIKEKIGCL
ncbi:MAG: DEAD/DEAH box helicase family protein [Zoogloeaceae bacterium]|jgi:type III restriction enzyme|nr:DEAD/DEAH box helicase family protein [Zoogloeaceae bacterium]